MEKAAKPRQPINMGMNMRRFGSSMCLSTEWRFPVSLTYPSTGSVGAGKAKLKKDLPALFRPGETEMSSLRYNKIGS